MLFTVGYWFMTAIPESSYLVKSSNVFATNVMWGIVLHTSLAKFQDEKEWLCLISILFDNIFSMLYHTVVRPKGSPNSICWLCKFKLTTRIASWNNREEIFFLRNTKEWGRKKRDSQILVSSHPSYLECIGRERWKTQWGRYILRCWIAFTL